MEFYKINQNELLNEISTNIKGGLHKTSHLIVEKPVVFVQGEKQIDKKTCDAMGYEVYEAQYCGGTIVGNKGDFVVIHFYRPENGFADRFTAYLVNWLKSKGLNATNERNDVLVDGYKVCGMAVTRYGRIDYTACFIGVNTNLDHIRAICKKPMVKVPRGLSEFGITTEEVETMFLDFCKKDKNNN